MRGFRSRRDALSSEESFERFVVGESARLLRVAFLLTGDRGEAEDLLQATFLRLLGHWRQVCDAPHGYALQVLVNLSRDRQRRIGRRVAGTQGLARPAPFIAGLADIVGHRDTATIAFRHQQKRVVESDRLRAKADTILHILSNT